MKARSRALRPLISLLATLGIIIPVALCARPEGGYRLPRIFGSDAEPPVARPPKVQLALIIRTLSELARSPSMALTEAQAKHVLLLIEPWRTNSRISDEQAQSLVEKLDATLTEFQRVRVKAWMERYAGYGGLGYRRAGRAPDMKQRLAIEAFRQIYNPLCSPRTYKDFASLSLDAQSHFIQRYAERMALVKQWETTAKVPKAKKSLPNAS